MDKIDHVLIVDDDRDLRELVGNYLEKNGMRVTRAANGREMHAALDKSLPDLIVLDLILPGEDGLALYRVLRESRHRLVPVMMISGRNDVMDRIVGLEMGADDYLTKPFPPRELLARIRAVLRRTRMLPPDLHAEDGAATLGFGNWRLDTAARQLLDPHDTPVALSGAEYRLLRVFLDHPQRVLTRDQLLNLTQRRSADPFDRSIDLLVSRLRQRLNDTARKARYIKTLRNEGYVFSAAVTALDERRASERSHARRAPAPHARSLCLQSSAV
ncbi:DNA-binding dual transcriptional regulator OmpR [Paraburkholderia tropica]|uniref:response regulator n=1 Tax=Paraburkholderia TaxID=1822464 RepID=UPI001CB05D3E|nr:MULTISPECIES: response regulator [Paraburkholderia]CAG9221632.1 DNA-binding dual transcriptional regulator OmpR [Paraburkholderia tropica]